MKRANIISPTSKNVGTNMKNKSHFGIFNIKRIKETRSTSENFWFYAKVASIWWRSKMLQKLIYSINCKCSKVFKLPNYISFVRLTLVDHMHDRNKLEDIGWCRFGFFSGRGKFKTIYNFTQILKTRIRHTFRILSTYSHIYLVSCYTLPRYIYIYP